MAADKGRGWWITRTLSAVTEYLRADENVRLTRAMLAELGWCEEHGGAAEGMGHCDHCDKAISLLGDKVAALRERNSRKQTLLRCARRAGLTSAFPLGRRAKKGVPDGGSREGAGVAGENRDIRGSA